MFLPISISHRFSEAAGVLVTLRKDMAKVNAKSWPNSVESKCQLAFSTEVCMIIIQAQSLNNYTAVENNPIIQKYFSKCAVCLYSANQPTISAPFQKAIIQQINPQSILTLEQLQLRQNLAAHQFLPQLLDQTLVNLFSNGLVFFHLKLDYPRTDCKNTALSLPQKTEVMEPQASCFLLGRVGLVGLAGSGLGCGSFQTGLLTSSLTFSMAFWKRERRSKLESIAPFLTILGTSSSFLLSLRDYQLLFRTNCTFRSLLVLGSLQGYQFFSSYCALLSSQRSSWSSLFTYDSWQILGFFDWILPVGSLQLLGAFLSSLIACVQKALGTLCLALFLAGRSSLQLFIQNISKKIAPFAKYPPPCPQFSSPSESKLPWTVRAESNFQKSGRPIKDALAYEN